MIKDFIIVSFIALVFILINSYDLNSWYYSAIGDEYAFYNYAETIAKGNEYPPILSQKGVYNIVPTFSSYYQAVVMRIFGINNFGWKFSSVLIVAATFFPYYFFIKNIASRKLALFSLIFFASSHYIWAFSHTGYWNIQVLFFPFLALCITSYAIKKDNAILFLMGGLTCALTFFTYFTARLTFPLLFLLIFIYSKKTKLVNRFLFITAGFLLLFIPFYLHNKDAVFNQMSERSLILTSEIEQNNKINYFIKNIYSSFKAIFSNDYTSHFVWGSLVDRVTGVFFAAGLILTAVKISKDRIFFAIFFIISLVITAGFSPYPYIPITRLYFLVPEIAFFAAVGFVFTMKFLRRNTISKVYASIVFLLVFGLNLLRFNFETPKHFHPTVDALAIKQLLSPNCRNNSFNIVIGSETRSPIPLLKPTLSAYQINNVTLLEYTDEIPETNGCVFHFSNL